MIRHILLYLLSLMITTNLTAQNIQQQTQQQLQNIVDSSKATVGIAVIDLTTQQLVFAINEKMVLPQASAIKIPILMEVYKQAHAHQLSLTRQVSVTPADKVGGSGVLKQMKDTVTLSIRELCVLMMTQSDNTATNVILQIVGINNVNQTMQAAGFSTTRVQRKMMDTEASAKGIENISTPAEAVAILNLLYQGKFINKAVSNDVLAVLKKTARQGSRIANPLPAQVSVSYKPGALPAISTEWAIVHVNQHPYAIAVMEKGKPAGDTSKVMERISLTVYTYFSEIDK
jgi:beta-lactamase class A